MKGQRTNEKQFLNRAKNQRKTNSILGGGGSTLIPATTLKENDGGVKAALTDKSLRIRQQNLIGAGIMMGGVVGLHLKCT